MFYKIKEFVKQIGDYSLEMSNKRHQINFKDADKDILSIVTEVDLHNSRAFQKFAKENFSDLSYMIIDEESIDALNGMMFEKIANTEYQFILDPIDGTINYRSGLPFYGVLLAVFKNGTPLYGFAYTPALDEFVYTDGEQIFREHSGKTEILKDIPRHMSSVIQAHPWEVKLKPEHVRGKFIVQDYFSAAVYSVYMAMGLFKGIFAKANLWDLAPMMAFAKVSGIGFYDYDTKEEITISPKYISDRGEIKRMQIIGYKDEFEEIKSVSSGVITTK